MRAPLFLAILAVSTMVRGSEADQLPTKQAGEKLEFEPDVLLPEIPPPPAAMDLQRAEAALDRAKRKAARWQQLQKSGVLSRVEAETAALQVVQLTAKLATARAASLRREAEEQRGKGSAEAAENAAQEAEKAAAQAQEELDRQKTEATARNLARQRQLQASGLISKAQLKRAEAATAK
jgi:multidrug resistance efflux pump